MKIKINKKILYTVIAVVFIGLFVNHIIKPLNFDTKLYLGAANENGVDFIELPEC